MQQIAGQVLGDAGAQAGQIHILAVELVNQQQSRHLGRILPHQFRADFNAGNGLNQDNRSVRCFQGGVYFTDKVGVTGGVKQIELRTLPFNWSNGSGGRAFALNLLLFKIHGRGA